MTMTREELKTLIELTQRAYKEDGIISVSFHADAMHMVSREFDNHFKTLLKMERYSTDSGVFYKKIAIEDGITFYTFVEEAEMTEKDKEDAEWFGVLPK